MDEPVISLFDPYVYAKLGNPSEATLRRYRRQLGAFILCGRLVVRKSSVDAFVAEAERKHKEKSHEQ